MPKQVTKLAAIKAAIKKYKLTALSTADGPGLSMVTAERNNQPPKYAYP